MAAYVSRYATAFLEVITAAKLDTAAIASQSDDFLAAWNESAELRTFFTNPAISSVQKIEILDKLNARLGMMKELRNLIAVLIHNDRIAAVSEVFALYNTLLQQQEGIRQAEIVTARPLSDSERESLLAGVGKLAGARIQASFKQDASILGGTVVRIGSTVYDGSVRGRLDRLKEALMAG